MASHRRPKPVNRARVSVLTATAATVVALSSQAGAHADPALTIDQAKAQVDDLNEQAEVKTEAYNAATEKQQQLQKQVGQLQDEVARQQAQVTTVQDSLAGIAAQQYREGGIPSTVQMMLSSSPDSFLRQAGSLSVVGGTQADLLKSFKQQQQKLDQEKAQAEQALTELDSTAKQLQADKADIRAKLAKAQDVLNSLTQQQRDQMAAAEAKAAADAKAQATAAAASAARASRSSARVDISVGVGSSHAAAAISAVKSALGSPYVYGATGPDSFDCSGLMQWAYAKAGVSLPRTSEEQAYAGTNIGTDIANAQPGDLIVYFSDMHHIGMYVGGGQIIHAPHTGAVVHYESATVMPIVKIVRP